MAKNYPFYLKSTVILFGLTLLASMFMNLREVFVPIAFAILIAILLNSLEMRFEKWGIPKVPAIFLSLIIGFFVIASVAYFITKEISGLSEQLPVLKKKFLILIQKAQQWINTQVGIPLKKQNQYIDEAESGLKPLIGTTVGSVIGTFGMVILLPVYTFLFLYYKSLLVNFLYESFAHEQEKEVAVVLTQTKSAIQQYMYGLLLEALIVATLNTTALLILGVEYAVLLGVLGAIINVLPFIGGILSIALPILIATVTKDGFQTQLWIIVCYIIIQFVDNHFLIPYIVSSKVKINALISIVIVLLGAVLWGIAGMFLSIPFIGVMKIIFDRIPEMKAWGKLLGTDIPTRPKRSLLLRRK